MQVARKFGVTAATPKWPNDVWVRGHKLAGNLVEDGRFNIPCSLNSLIILGIGINVNSDVRRNPELSSIATSIKCERGGKSVNREQFLADICACLEHNIEQTRDIILDIFRQENLFHAYQDISVFCPSEGRVIDGKFLEICDNWEVRFSDKSNEKIFQGRSDQYTVRPKALKKILIIFTTQPAAHCSSVNKGDGRAAEGGQDSSAESTRGEDALRHSGITRRSAQKVASMLQALVDTSKYVVCLVPESLITDTDDWMRTCSLLILPEPLANPALVSSKLNTFLSHDGKVLASGQGSLFVAKSLNIPLKEFTLQLSQSHTDFSTVRVKATLPTIPGEPTLSSPQPQTTDTLEESLTDIKSCAERLSKLSTGTSPSSRADQASLSLPQADTIVFPSEHICFQFFEDEKAMLAESSVSLQGTQDNQSKDQSQQEQETNAKSEKTPSLTPGKAKVWAVYSETDSVTKPSIAACTIKSCIGASSCITLIGYDIGIDSPLSTSSASQVEEEIQRLTEDRFKREAFVQQIADSLLTC